MKSTPEPRRVVGTIGFILAGLFVFVGGGALFVWFGVLKPYADTLERPRIPLLRKVAAAQAEFHDRDLDGDGVRDFAFLKELLKAGLLKDREVHKAGLVFVEPSTGDAKNRWWAVAQPLHPGQGRSFFINQTGRIYVSADNPWDLKSRVNQKTAEAPAGAQLMLDP